MYLSKYIGTKCVLRIGWCVLNAAIVASSVGQQPAATRQPATRPRLSGPALKPAPALSQWTISYTYPEERSSAPASAPHPKPGPDLPRRVVVARDGAKFHEEVWNVGGDKKRDCWQQNQSFYEKPLGQSYWSAYGKPTDLRQAIADHVPNRALPESGFRNVEWINDQTYIGSVKAGQSTYLVFVPRATADLNIDDPKSLQKQPTIAYVESLTRLPVSVTSQNVVQTYKFSGVSAALTLPADLTAEITKGDQIRAKLNAAPAREY